MEKPAVARTSVRPPVVVEEAQPLEVYKAMLKQVEEIHKAALVLESGVELAALLSEVGMVKVHIEAVIEKLQMDMQMAADMKRYEEERGDGRD